MTKKGRKETKSSVVKRMLTGKREKEKRGTMFDERLKALETAKIGETRLIAEMMFGINALAMALGDKKMKTWEKVKDADGNLVLDSNGAETVSLVERPMFTAEEIHYYRNKVISDYHAERMPRQQKENLKSEERTVSGAES